MGQLDTTIMARLDEINIVKNYSIREFYNKHGQDAVACNRNWEGTTTPCIRFGGTVFAAISKSCHGATARTIFKNPENYQVIQLHDTANSTDFYRVSAVGSNYYNDFEQLSL